VRRALTTTALLLRNSAELREGHETPRRRAASDCGTSDEGRSSRSSEPRHQRPARDARGREAVLERRCRAVTAGVVLTVRDESIGIPAEELDSLFQPFHGSFAKGSGLGLAIVHRIVADYSGEIP